MYDQIERSRPLRQRFARHRISGYRLPGLGTMLFVQTLLLLLLFPYVHQDSTDSYCFRSPRLHHYQETRRNYRRSVRSLTLLSSSSKPTLKWFLGSSHIRRRATKPQGAARVGRRLLSEQSNDAPEPLACHGYCCLFNASLRSPKSAVFERLA